MTQWTKTALLAGAFAIATQGVALADGYRGSEGGHPMMWGGGWGGMIFGPIMMLVFIGLAAAVVVVIVRWLWPGASGGPGGRSRALEILEERFARGEIDAAEFEERRRALTK